MADEKQQPPAEEADIQERINGFNSEVKALLGKYELGLSAVPFVAPDGRLAANPILVSSRARSGKVAADDGGLVQG